MKKLFYFILLFYIFICCNNKESKNNKTILYYPTKNYFIPNKQVEIDLNNKNLNFKKIANLAELIAFKDSIPYVLIKQNDTIKKIILYRNMSEKGKSCNRLTITKDSIFLITENYHINNIHQILKNHYENNGKNILYPDNAEKAWIEIELDTSASTQELKNILKFVIKSFDIVNKEHNDSLKLKIGLDYFSQTPLPPLPIPFNEK